MSARGLRAVALRILHRRSSRSSEMSTRLSALASVVAVLTFPVACSDSTSPPSGAASGTIVVQLTDAPFLTDSLRSVDIFVVRVEARVAAADSAAADANLVNGASAGWKVLA